MFPNVLCCTKHLNTTGLQMFTLTISLLTHFLLLFEEINPHVHILRYTKESVGRNNSSLLFVHVSVTFFSPRRDESGQDCGLETEPSVRFYLSSSYMKCKTWAESLFESYKNSTYVYFSLFVFFSNFHRAQTCMSKTCCCNSTSDEKKTKTNCSTCDTGSWNTWEVRQEMWC